MDSKDVVSILKACKDLGVKKLKVGELQVDFHNLTDFEPNVDTAKNEAVTEVQEVPILTPEESTELKDDFENSFNLAFDPVAFEENQLRMANGISSGR